MSERLTKKQLKEDHFVEAVQKGLVYAKENPLVVGAGILGFVALVVLAVRIGGSAAGLEGSTVNVEAQSALTEARSEFALGRLDTGTAALEEIRQRWSKDDVGREATYILANAHLEAGNWAEAKTTFEEFLGNPLHEDLLVDGARIGIAACLEVSGDLAAAADSYTAIWKDGTTPATRIQAALAAARCARSSGNPTGALELLQSVLETFPGVPEADEVRFEVLRLESGRTS